MIPETVEEFALRYGCVLPGRLSGAQTMCKASGLELCSLRESLQIAQHLQKDGATAYAKLALELNALKERNYQPLDNATAFNTEVVRSLVSLEKCLLLRENDDSMQDVPFASSSFRVWVAGDDREGILRPERKTKLTDFQFNGALHYEFDTCVRGRRRRL